MNVERRVRGHALLVYFTLAYGITSGGILALHARRRLDLAAPGRQDLILVFACLILGPSTSGGVFTPDALSSMPGRGIGWAHGRPRRNRVGGEQGFAGTQSSAVPLSLGQIEDCMFPIHGQ